MEPTIWDALLRPGYSGVPYVADFLGGEDEADNARLRIGLPESGPSVTLTRQDRFVVAELWLGEGTAPPTDEQKQRMADDWRYERSAVVPVARPVWSLSWRWFDDAPVRAARGRAVVELLRDVLALPAEHVAVRGADDNGPTDLYRLRDFDDRPTASGAAPACADWDDLRRRLDWLVTTLAADSAVILSGPGDAVVQFMTARHGGSIATSVIDPALDPDRLPREADPGSERARRMFAGGWYPAPVAPGVAEWTLGDREIHGGADAFPRQAVDALQALGAGSPAELTVRSFRNGPHPDPAYVAAELGLRPDAP